MRFLCLALVLVLAACSGETVESHPPNVLFIAVDDMNDWVGCLGSDRVPTPNIDALANRGVLFSNAHAASPKCAPSRAAILLGRRAPNTGLYSNGHWWKPAFPDAVTLPRYFRDHGYYVAGGGKIHHHTAGFNPPDQWDEYSDLVPDQDLVPKIIAPLGLRWLTNMPRHPNGSLDWGPVELDDLELGDGYTVKWAVEFLQREHSKPFFLAVGLFQPHLPFYAPKKYFDELPEDEVQVPFNKEGDLDDVPPGGLELAASRREDLRMIEKFDSLTNCVRSYLNSIRHADSLLGILMKAFDQSVYANNTIIVFWSDNGYHFGEKDHLAKDTLWERSTHVPLIFVVPGVTRARSVSSRPVDLTCLYPTLVSLCGLPPKDGLDGLDITPLLEDPHRPWDYPAIIDFLEGNRSVVTETHRYIRYREGGEEVYDRVTDPDEWENLAGREELNGVKDRLRKWLPIKWAKAVPKKGAYQFDPSTYTWTAAEGSGQSPEE
ncbi:sulfatase [Acidobacteria bacterium AH-259-A15]|nr:sulfatase [Acidobacteria bacterium AH-259-A15]